MITVGLSGVLLIMLFSVIESMSKVLEGILFLIGASFLWAVRSSYMSESNQSKKTSLLPIGIQMLAGGILLSLSGILVGELNNLDLLKVSFQSYF